MNKTARIRKRLILLIAFSIIWVFIGSLVIFHQEQVMGKSFKWNKITFVIPKSKDEESAAKIKAELSSDHHQPLILAALDDNRREQLLAGYFVVPALNEQQRINPGFTQLFFGLRAPPLA